MWDGLDARIQRAAMMHALQRRPKDLPLHFRMLRLAGSDGHQGPVCVPGSRPRSRLEGIQRRCGLSDDLSEVPKQGPKSPSRPFHTSKVRCDSSNPVCKQAHGDPAWQDCKFGAQTSQVIFHLRPRNCTGAQSTLPASLNEFALVLLGSDAQPVQPNLHHLVPDLDTSRRWVKHSCLGSFAGGVKRSRTAGPGRRP